jgi:hypothetical protein
MWSCPYSVLGLSAKVVLEELGMLWHVCVIKSSSLQFCKLVIHFTSRSQKYKGARFIIVT